MVPYILLIFLSFIFCFVSIKKETNERNRVIIIGDTNYIKNNNLAIPIYFFIYFLLLSLRHTSVGNDTLGYQKLFLEFSSINFSNVFSVDTDPLYALLNWTVMQFTDNFQVFLVICSVITVFPLAYVYSKDREYSFFKIILFSTLTPYVMMFSGVRQSIAISIGMIAYIFVKNKKLIFFILAVIVATGFHHSAFVLLFMYPLYHTTFKKKDLIYIVPIILGIFIFNKPIFSYLTNFLSRFSDEYTDVTITDTGAIGSLVLFIAFAVFCYVIPDEEKMNRECIGLRNLLLFSVILQCFTPLHSLAMRLNYYYIIFIPMIVTNVLTVQRAAYRQIALWGSRIMTLFFTFDFLYTLYTSYTTGISTLNTIPYKFFWQ